jgi:choline kinase
MKVVRSGDRLLRIGKVLPGHVPDAESIGFLAFRAEGGAPLRRRGRADHARAGRDHQLYLKVIDGLAATGMVSTRSIRGLAWAEVDYPADVEIARALTDAWAAEGL